MKTIVVGLKEENIKSVSISSSETVVYILMCFYHKELYSFHSSVLFVKVIVFDIQNGSISWYKLSTEQVVCECHTL